MGDTVTRYSFYYDDMDESDTGNWVAYEDYEVLREKFNKALEEISQLNSQGNWLVKKY